MILDRKYLFRIIPDRFLTKIGIGFTIEVIPTNHFKGAKKILIICQSLI